MTSSISDTLAVVKDTAARVKILGNDAAKTIKGNKGSKKVTADDISINDTVDVDSTEIHYAKKDSSYNCSTIDSAWSSNYNNTSYKLFPYSTDSTFQAYATKDIRGVQGIPVSGDTARSNILSIIVLVCFFITMTIFSLARNYISRQTKKFFVKTSKERSFTTETLNEVKLNIYFVIQTCIIFSLLTYIFSTIYIDQAKIKFSLTLLIPASTALYLIYFVIKSVLYAIADNVFYNDKNIRRKHADDLSYIMTMQGLLLFPSLLLTISAGIDTYTLTIYVISVIVFAKLLTFYKTISTFSGHYKSFLQIILYFCALEMIPLMSLGGILVMIVKYL